MKQASMGNNVKVHYKGTFDDGTVFDSSLDCDPLEFTIGGKQVIPGFEDCVKPINFKTCERLFDCVINLISNS